MKKIILTALAAIAITSMVNAQYVDQALIFSQQNFGSTARSKAMGNAFGALGGDFSSLSINPAGIGVYQRTEITTSVNVLNMNRTETTYQGEMGEDKSNKFNFSNVGFVGSFNMIDKGATGLVAFNYGVGMNRLNNFNQNVFTQAFNSSYSRMDAFAQNTNGIYYDDLVTYSDYDPYYNGIPWESKMAWENYLIDVANPSEGGDLYNSILYENETVNQFEYIDREGYMNEYLFSFGANINHRVYLGGTLSFHDLYFDEAKTYSEDGLFGSFDYTNRSTSDGNGFNLKIGAIVRPVPALRLGIALHTPTYYQIKETYSSVMSSNLQDVGPEADGPHREETPIGQYEYRLNTPMRTIASIAYQIGTKALISFDYEYVNYQRMKLRKGSDGYGFGSENSEIDEIYSKTNNFRVGAEYRLTDKFSLRGGAEFLGNPYNANAYNTAQPNRDYNFTTYNGGFGYRNKNLSFDVSYSYGDRTKYSYIYQVDGFDVEPVKYHSLTHEVMFTLGIRL